MSEDAPVEPPAWVRAFELERWARPEDPPGERGEHAALRRWMAAGFRWIYEHDPSNPISLLIEQGRRWGEKEGA